MFTETEIEDIYHAGGHPRVWKVWKILWAVILSPCIPLILWHLFFGVQTIAYFFLFFLLALSPIWAVMTYLMSPGAEKKRIRKIDAFTEGTVKKVYNMYGIRSFEYVYIVDGNELKGLDGCRSLPNIGDRMDIGYISSKPKSSKLISITTKNSNKTE